MVKMACYKAKDIDRLIELINNLQMPILENADTIKEIREILVSAISGEMEGGEKSGVEQEKVHKD